MAPPCISPRSAPALTLSSSAAGKSSTFAFDDLARLPWASKYALATWRFAARPWSPPSAAASWRRADAVPSASRTERSFSASAARMVAVFWLSAAIVKASALPWASLTRASLSPSDRITLARLVRSAAICISIDCRISALGMMSRTSTRVILTPHEAVASSRSWSKTWLMRARARKVSSRVKLPISARSCVSTRFWIPATRFWIAYTALVASTTFQ
mmetsp:Transcript_90057/g.263285  ORF Transcript_90057/g.263285 Transcript_90057/m.263285 type:complete len:216 (-) Transcript_90057:387-1034(-)